MGFIVAAMFIWPWIDRLLVRVFGVKEVSVYLGIAAVLAIVCLTVWEAAVPH
jgi:quinol-cytochrome oxidoreductase complex cytochrome b subunit